MLAPGLNVCKPRERLRQVVGVSSALSSAAEYSDRVKTRLFSVAVVAGVHLFLLLALLSYTPFSREQRQRELSVSVITPHSESSPDTPPAFQKPAMDMVPAPEIAIAEEGQNVLTQVAVADPSRLLPPRPDPAHANTLPDLPSMFHRLGPTASALVRVLVLSDGSISDARITRSTGEPKLDAIAVLYVKQHWRFLPALASGTAVQSWTTTLVMFKSV